MLMYFIPWTYRQIDRERERESERKREKDKYIIGALKKERRIKKRIPLVECKKLISRTLIFKSKRNCT